MRGDNNNRPLAVRLFGAMLGLLLCGHGLAAEVRVQVQPGLDGLADYQEGEPDKPALLILHGFLQTREFHTVARMAEALSIAGYTVLTPTLSLNVPTRNTSLPCEAVHTHTMDQSLNEIDSWVRWLKARGHADIVLLGHSYGGVQLAAYLATHRPAGVSRLIAVSLVDVEHGVGDTARADQARAEQEARSAPKSLRRYSLHYCRDGTYTTTAQAYHSYVRWARAEILEALRGIPVPVVAVAGSADHRMGPDWPELVASTGAGLVMVEGANHFFDARHEAPLHDTLERLLTQQSRSGAR